MPRSKPYMNWKEGWPKYSFSNVTPIGVLQTVTDSEIKLLNQVKITFKQGIYSQDLPPEDMVERVNILVRHRATYLINCGWPVKLQCMIDELIDECKMN